jgi:glycogen operon protein
VDDSFLLLFNANDADMPFTLPDADYGERWAVVVDTASPFAERASVKADDQVTVESRSLVVLRRVL